MIKEEKTIFISILLILVLGFSNLFQTGKLIFTFPINEFLFLFICIYFMFYNFQQNKILYILILLFAIFQSFSQIYNWEFFLDQKQLTSLSDGILTDILEFFTYLSYLIILIPFFFNNKNKMIILSYFFILAIFILAEIFSNKQIILITYVISCFFIGFFIEEKRKQFYDIYLLLILNTFLFATKIVTLYYC